MCLLVICEMVQIFRGEWALSTRISLVGIMSYGVLVQGVFGGKVSAADAA